MASTAVPQRLGNRILLMQITVAVCCNSPLRLRAYALAVEEGEEAAVEQTLEEARG